MSSPGSDMSDETVMPNPQHALKFEMIAHCATSRARLSKMHLPHQCVDTPVFMPVGTQGTMKGLACQQLRELGCQIMLANTYHLGLRPGEDLLRAVNGLHNFMGWDRALLTDSGGFQMVSLLQLAQITESPRDGSLMLLTPEKSIELQNAIGADIIMQLDDVVHTLTSGPRVEEAMHRTIRWLDRCIAAHKKPGEQNIFPIVQGGTDLELRSKCIAELIKRNMPGYAIGGLSGGEDKGIFWRTVSHCTKLLPRDKPVYCMGVGYAVDLVICVALGVDMFDCVYPTRTARFGTAITRFGNLPLKQTRFKDDFSPIDDNCSCYTCQNFTRAYLFSIVNRDTVACHLLTIHNLAFQLDLMKRARSNLQIGRFPDFVRGFLLDWFGSREAFPLWVIEALGSAADLSGNTKIQLGMISLCYEIRNLAELEGVVNSLVKKRGLLKQAITATVKQVLEWAHKEDMDSKLKLLSLVRSVTDGKIYVEVERAQATRALAQILEASGNLRGAAEVMQELQVETFGSMNKREKVDFILEQIRLAVVLNEFQKARIISRKVTQKTFESDDFEDLKLRFLELMIALALNDKRYLECSRHYLVIADAKSLQIHHDKVLAALKLAVVFIVIAKHEPEQWEFLNALHRDRRLDQLALYKELLRTFLTRELVRWPIVEQAFGAELRQSFPLLFGDVDPASKIRWEQLSRRVMEHNVRTLGAYYNNISLTRFAELIEVPSIDEAECVLGELVSDRMVHATIDRPSRVIRFSEPDLPDSILNQWNNRVDSLLSLMVKTNHHVAKEAIVNSVLSRK